jgi:DNA modification methylase
MTLEEHNHLFNSLKFIVSCSLNKQTLPGYCVTMEYLIEKQLSCFQLFVPTGGFYKNLKYNQVNMLFDKEIILAVPGFFFFFHTHIIKD